AGRTRRTRIGHVCVLRSLFSFLLRSKTWPDPDASPLIVSCALTTFRVFVAAEWQQNTVLRSSIGLLRSEHSCEAQSWERSGASFCRLRSEPDGSMRRPPRIKRKAICADETTEAPAEPSAAHGPIVSALASPSVPTGTSYGSERRS